MSSKNCQKIRGGRGEEWREWGVGEGGDEKEKMVCYHLIISFQTLSPRSNHNNNKQKIFCDVSNEKKKKKPRGE